MGPVPTASGSRLLAMEPVGCTSRDALDTAFNFVCACLSPRAPQRALRRPPLPPRRLRPAPPAALSLLVKMHAGQGRGRRPRPRPCPRELQDPPVVRTRRGTDTRVSPVGAPGRRTRRIAEEHVGERRLPTAWSSCRTASDARCSCRIHGSDASEYPYCRARHITTNSQRRRPYIRAARVARACTCGLFACLCVLVRGIPQPPQQKP